MGERIRLLELATQLAEPELRIDLRLNIVAHMRRVLIGKQAYPLAIPTMLEEHPTQIDLVTRQGPAIRGLMLLTPGPSNACWPCR